MKPDVCIQASCCIHTRYMPDRMICPIKCNQASGGKDDFVCNACIEQNAQALSFSECSKVGSLLECDMYHSCLFECQKQPPVHIFSIKLLSKDCMRIICRLDVDGHSFCSSVELHGSQGTMHPRCTPGAAIIWLYMQLSLGSGNKQVLWRVFACV